MPWTEPNPITGASRWEPTLAEMQQNALNLYAWLLPARAPHSFAALAHAIRARYVTEGDDMAARRNRAFAEALEREPERLFHNGAW
ncbi:hypothetical protein HMPREF0326_01503 [Desulfovibrio sp. 3_1_syn3]|uniref:hypothetical protein n=1 Tax=Desulfovibrio sp. 3_1_syn3 TaxID=457398 RepID=UPI0001E12A60|nr:hypothetical protein [Desulfovibrio sp. 3_1_syn3]EFL85800.1 hypothetical protein HMPREF0326_01503 [Desulfovibrio sp. 3_1_syn3]